MTTPRSLAVGLVLSVLAGGLSGVVATRYAGQRVEVPIVTVATSTIMTALQQQEFATIDVVRNASPAVVSIVITKALSTSRSPDQFFSDLFNDRFIIVPSSTKNGAASSTQRLRVGGGSGFFVAADGYIVTNKHVVEDKEAEYTVVLQDGRELPGKVLALDPSLDLAVIKVEGTNFPVLPLGDSDQIETGQTVIAIGNALAEFQNTVTKGIISGINRHLIAGAGIGSEVIEGAIQTDAAINPGNSGGPLINLLGQVIGVNTAISESAQSLGFALPINVVKQAVESVKRTGRIVRPWLGVRYIQIDKELAEEKQLKQSYGVLIQGGAAKKTEPAVIPDSPAQKAGLVENDIILEINGRKIDRDHSLAGSIAQFAPGDKIELKILHQDKEKTIQVILAERKDQ